MSMAMPVAAATTEEAFDFDRTLAEHALPPLRRDRIDTVQVNVGKLCNQACHHCHVDAGPKRTEIMTRETTARLLDLLRANRLVHTVDLTGGAPELNPNFEMLVTGARALGRRLIVRCNLTVLFVPGMEDLPRLYRENDVELVCSLPCYTKSNVDRQRGRGVFEASIEALLLLNRNGYGLPDSPRRLDLVYNPGGPDLPPAQVELEDRYHQELRSTFGIEFHHLRTITNMPIKRFAEQLLRAGRYDEYMGLLINHFNPDTVAGLMCRGMLSIDWEGTLYDCDFNQMLELPLIDERGRRVDIRNIDDLDRLRRQSIATGSHCFGCTAGAGSSCSGALA